MLSTVEGNPREGGGGEEQRAPFCRVILGEAREGAVIPDVVLTKAMVDAFRGHIGPLLQRVVEGYGAHRVPGRELLRKGGWAGLIAAELDSLRDR